MSAHTPGPWTVRLLKSKEHRVSAPGWDSFAIVYGNEDDTDLDRQGRANARLVAAAPALLAAAHKALAAHEDAGCSCDGCAALRAAIAQAEGKS